MGVDVDVDVDVSALVAIWALALPYCILRIWLQRPDFV